MSDTNTLGLALLIYIAGITAASIWWARRIKTTTDFLLGGRALPAFVVAGSTLATIIGTGATIGASGYAYQHGLAGCLYGLGQSSGIIFVGLAFAPMRRHRFMTLGEELAAYYGGNQIVYHFANITMFGSLVCWIAVQIMGAARYLGVLLDSPEAAAVILTGFAFAALTLIGGYVAVVYTDTIQCFILVIGFVALAALGVSSAGGWEGLQAKTPASYWSLLGTESVGWGSTIGIPLALALSYVSEPSFRHRIYSARSEAGAKWSMIIPGLIAAPFSLVIALLGMTAFAFNPSLESADHALPWLALEVFPLWATGAVLVSGFAATFSSGNSDAASGAVFFVRHIYQLVAGKPPTRPLLVSRLAIAAMIAGATVMAGSFGSIVDFVVVFVSVLGSGLGVVILLGRFWPAATWQGALAAILTGGLVSCLIEFLPSQKALWDQPILPATLAALLAHIAVSRLTPSAKASVETIAAQFEAERRATI